MSRLSRLCAVFSSWPDNSTPPYEEAKAWWNGVRPEVVSNARMKMEYGAGSQPVHQCLILSTEIFRGFEVAVMMGVS